MVNENNCIQRSKPERKTIGILIRVTPTVSKELKERKLSPTAIFYEALKELKVV